MRVKLDENVTAHAKLLFTAAGHDVETVPDEGMTGVSDAQLLERCAQEGRLLVTFDVGFGDVREHPPGSHAGILLLRLHDQQPQTTIDVLRRVLGAHDLSALARAVVVVTDETVRIRRPEEAAGGHP